MISLEGSGSDHRTLPHVLSGGYSISGVHYARNPCNDYWGGRQSKDNNKDSGIRERGNIEVNE